MSEVKGAATLVPLRQSEAGIEVLLMQRNSAMAYGGAWVFPGGRIDAVDSQGLAQKDEVLSARHAAARECKEEASLHINPDELVLLSRWTTPIMVNQPRYRTWFFAVDAGPQPVQVDGQEMKDHRWLTIGDAVSDSIVKELGLLPPTFVTLTLLNQFNDLQSLLSGLKERTPAIYSPRVTQTPTGHISLYEGDGGYDAHDVSVQGPRHRLTSHEGLLTYERDF